MAGNTVILKHSFLTPLCAERLADAFAAANFPPGVFQYLHATHEDLGRLINDERIGFVAFTGSVAGGHAVQQTANQRFVGTGMELGGKDPAYVRADVNLNHAVENLVDGAFFNSGQSCCGIERIYVDSAIYDAFVEGAVELTKQYRLGRPLGSETTLGPVVSTRAAALVPRHIEGAGRRGAGAPVGESLFPAAAPGPPYPTPPILLTGH